MSDLKKLTEKIIKFRDLRDWKQFHNPKDSAIALISETTELLDLFKWKNEKEIKELIRKNRKEIEDEVIDVLFWILLIAHDLKINIKKAFEEKMIENNKKYPIEKSKGRHTKYNKL